MRIICAVLFWALAIAGDAMAESSSASFLKAFEKYSAQKPTSRDWLSENSPWFPYLVRPFYESLNEDQKRIYLRYQTGPYHCDEIADLDLTGFLRASPSMRKVMKNPLILRNFLTHVARPLSPGVIRCESLHLLYPIIHRNKSDEPIDRMHAYAVEKMPPLNVVLLAKKGKPRGWATQQPETYLRTSRARGLETLMVLAIRYEYPPALRDVIEFILDGRHVQLPTDLEYYLLTVSELVGDATQASLKRSAYLESTLPNERQKQISAAAYAGNIGLAKINGWHCRGPRARQKIAGNLLCTKNDVQAK